MKTNQKLKNDVFFFDEKKFQRAQGEMSNYAKSCNNIVQILNEHELYLNHSNAFDIVFADLDSIRNLIIANWHKAAEEIKGLNVEVKTPQLHKIQYRRDNLTKRDAFNAGFIPRNYLVFTNGKFSFDEAKLKEHFTIYRNRELNKIEKITTKIVNEFEKLKSVCKNNGFGPLMDFQGILLYDHREESLTFNRSSPDFINLKKQRKKQRKNSDV